VGNNGDISTIVVIIYVKYMLYSYTVVYILCICYIYIYIHVYTLLYMLHPLPPQWDGSHILPPYEIFPLPLCGLVGVWHCPPPPVVWWGCGMVLGMYGDVWCVWSVWYGMFGKYGMLGMYGRYGMYGMNGWHCMDGRYGM